MVENICFTTSKVVLKEETSALSLQEVYWKMKKCSKGRQKGGHKPG